MQALRLLSCIALLATLSTAAQSYTYPTSINDTSKRDDPFFLQVSEINIAAYAGRPIQLNFLNNSKELGAFVNPAAVVGEFVLKNGSLQVAAQTPYFAQLTPLPTVDSVIRHQFSFTTNRTANTNVWELVSVANDGVFGLLNQVAQYARFNGFAICNLTAENTYQIEYQSSKTGANVKGCEGIALHAYMGPPY